MVCVVEMAFSVDHSFGGFDKGKLNATRLRFHELVVLSGLGVSGVNRFHCVDE